MPNLRLTFTDPATRRPVTIEAQRSEAEAVEGDGFVQFGVDGFEGDLRIPREALTAPQVDALRRALANPELADLSVQEGPNGLLSSISVRTSDLGAEVNDHVATALPGVNIDATGARRPVSFSGDRFSATLGERPEGNPAIGEGLFAAASLIDDAPGNAVDAMALSEKQRAKLLGSLRRDLMTAAPGQTAAGLDERQTLQMRSAASTVLLELISAKDSPKDLKVLGLRSYLDTMEAEPNPTLRDSMAWNLRRLSDKLPGVCQADIRKSLDTVRPENPPYEQWFKDGDNTVTVDWTSGSESLGDDKKRLIKEGFEEVSSSFSAGSVLRKTVEVDGRETNFELRLRPFRSNMFDAVEDPKTDMVIYTGHSNWGRNMRSSLERVSGEGGGAGKLVLADLCVGKGEMQQVKDKFPNLDLVTTHNSSYFIPGSATREAESEGINAILATFDGIAKRSSYAAIAKDVRRRNPWGSTHRRHGVDNNFIFPGDEIVRRRVLDRDHDGQADILDRVVDFNSFKPATDASRDFEPIAGRPADILDGTKLHFAAMTVTRLGCYSETLDHVTKDGRVTPTGMFDPAPGETNIFRFEHMEIGGREGIAMSMNAHYAHSSEEALRAAASYEFARFIEGDRGNPLHNRLNALVFASHSLHTDAGGRDNQIWDALLKAKGLPVVRRSDVEAAKNSDHDYYSGSRAASKALAAKLDEATIEALGAVN